MPHDIPPLLLTYNDAQDPVVVVEQIEVASVEALAKANPDLLSQEHAAELAGAVNHLVHEQTFTIIDDPENFISWYRSTYAAEDPNAAWDENTFQLRNFPYPDLKAIAAPAIEGGKLTFFAVNGQIGMPYRVSLDAAGETLGQPEYEPLEADQGAAPAATHVPAATAAVEAPNDLGVSVVDDEEDELLSNFNAPEPRVILDNPTLDD